MINIDPIIPHEYHSAVKLLRKFFEDKNFIKGRKPELIYSKDKKQEEFITNLAQMKDGKMVIEIGSSSSLKEYFKGQSTVKLEELTQEQVNQLVEYQNELKTMTAEEVVKQQASDIENMKRDVNYIAALLRIQAGRITTESMIMGLSATTGQPMKELETSFAEFSKNQTGPIQQIQNEA
jgi:ADP-heptose:LPS heptosyltransferase